MSEKGGFPTSSVSLNKKFNAITKSIGWFTIIILCVMLFGVVFSVMGLSEPDAGFFIELLIVTMFLVNVRISTYNTTEEFTLRDKEILDAKENYDIFADESITNITNFNIFIDELNEKNKKTYIENKLSSKSKDNFRVFGIFKGNYEKYKEKVTLRAEKLKKIKPIEVTNRCETKLLYSSRNRAVTIKSIYITTSSISSVVLSIIMATLMFKELMFNIMAIFKYTTYLGSIVYTIYNTRKYSAKTTRTETLFYLNRLTEIVSLYNEWEYKNMEKTNEENIRLESI